MDILEEINLWVVKHKKNGYELFQDRKEFEEYIMKNMNKNFKNESFDI